MVYTVLHTFLFCYGLYILTYVHV